MSNTRQKIVLTYSNTSLADKIAPDTEHCHILLDSAGGAFTVTLPDAQSTMKRELIFKNIGSNTVTIQAKSGQYIDYATSHDLAYLDLISVWSDLVRTWWLSDVNKSIIIDRDFMDVPVANPWRIVIVGTDLHFQRYESGVWVNKSQVLASESL